MTPQVAYKGAINYREVHRNVSSLRQKGKIAPAEWPTIVARHNAGEPLSRIARDYGCTGPAIGYIIRRAAVVADGPQPGGSRNVPEGNSLLPVKHAPLPGAGRAGRVLDPALRDRITGEIANLLCALDLAITDPSTDAFQALVLSCDNIMRAAARIRIELERSVAADHTASPVAPGTEPTD